MNRTRVGALPTLILVGAVAASVLAAPISAAADPPVSVEGESPVSTNFTPSFPTDTAASGGEYLQLSTTTAPPSGGYTVEYDLDVPSAGFYELHAVTTPPASGSWSWFVLSVNNENITALETVVTITASLAEWTYGIVELDAGSNEVKLTVNAPAGGGATYLLEVDRLIATPAVPILSVEGESAVTTNFSPGATTAPGASNDAFLVLNTGADPDPDIEYSAEYEFYVHDWGWYELTAVMTPPVATWASPISVVVNGGTPTAVTQPRLLEQVSELLGRYHLGYFQLELADNSVVISTDQRREAPDDNYLVIIDSLEVEVAARTVVDFSANGPYNVLEAGDPANELDLGLNVPAAVSTTVDWEIRDFDGTLVDSGSEALAASGQSVAVDVSALPVGYYTVTAEVASDMVPSTSAFAVVPALSSRSALGDTPFALDVAGAWLVPSADQAAFADLIELSGVSWIRDRMRWNDAVNPTANTFEFAEDADAEAFTTLVAANGINILGMYQDSPSWTRDSGETLPDDLFAVYEYAKEQAGQFADRVQAWEVFNETDHTFTSATEAADRYAAVLKAATIGYRDSGEDVLVSSAGMAWARDAYGDLFGANETFGYTDIFNYHAHRLESDAAVPALPDHGVAWRDLLTDNSAQQQVWLSEAGMALASDPIAGPSPTQQRALARYVVTSTVQSLASGNDRHFFFVAPHYREAGADWGMVTSEGTPTPGFVAESVMTYALGEGEYVGPLAGTPSGVTAHTFRDGGDLVTVAWAESASTYTLALGASSAEVTTIMGETSSVGPLPFSTNYSVALSPTPVYLRYDDPGSGTPDAPYTAGALSSADRIVVVPDFGSTASADAKEAGYALSYEGVTEVSVDIYNFGSSTMAGDLVSTSTGDWVFDDASVPVSIPAMSKVTVPLEVTAGSGLDFSATERLSFRVEFTGADSTASVAAVHAVLRDAAVEHVVAAGEHAVRLTFTNTTAGARTLDDVTIAVGAEDDEVVVGEVLSVDESITVVLPLPDTTGAQTQYSLELGFASGPSATYVGSMETPSVGGLLRVGNRDPNELADPTGFVDLTEDGTIELPGHSGPSDLGGTVVFSTDEDTLYVEAVIDDNTFSQPYDGAGIWQADSIQVAVSRGLPGESAAIAELAAALTPEGSQAYLFQTLDPEGAAGPIAGGSVVVVRDEGADTTTYTLEIPWEVLLGSSPPEGAALGLSILVNDSDGSTRRGYLEWWSGIADTKDPSTFKGVYLGT